MKQLCIHHDSCTPGTFVSLFFVVDVVVVVVFVGDACLRGTGKSPEFFRVWKKNF